MRMILPVTAALSLALAANAFAGEAPAKNLILAQQKIVTPSPLPPRVIPLSPSTPVHPRSEQGSTDGSLSFEERILRNLQKLQDNKQGEVGTKKSDKGKQDSSKP